jgi:hypothetical protein
MPRIARIRTVPTRTKFSALLLTLGLIGGCGMPGAERNGPGGGDGWPWNGEGGQTVLLRTRAMFHGFAGVARRFQLVPESGWNGVTFFNRALCNRVDPHCIELNSLSEAEYEQLRRFAFTALPRLLALTDGPDAATIEVATAHLYLGPPAPEHMRRQRQYAMASASLRKIVVDPIVLFLNDADFVALMGHELGHLLGPVVVNGVPFELNYDREPLAAAFGAGLKLALDEQPKPLTFDESFNFNVDPLVDCRNGMACVELPGTSTLTGLAVLPSRKIVVAGTHVHPQPQGPPRTELFVARFLASGVPDTTFGTQGTYRYQFQGQPTYGGPVVEATNNRLLVLARHAVGNESRLTFLMLDDAGRLVSTYGNGGVHVEPAFSVARSGSNPPWQFNRNTLNTAIRLPDGAILAGGESCIRRTVSGVLQTDCVPLLIKLTGDGRFDETFGDTRWRAGRGVAELLTPWETSNVYLLRLAVDPNDGIVGLAAARTSTGIVEVLRRWTKTGAVDRDFGAEGSNASIRVPLASSSDLLATARGITVGGRAPSSSRPGVVRLGADGKALDLGFATRGSLTMVTSYSAFGMLPERDGHVLVGIDKSNRLADTLFVTFALLNGSGTLVPPPRSEGTSAQPLVHVRFPVRVLPNHFAVQPWDRLILVAGRTNFGGTRPEKAFVARLWTY